MNRVLRQFALFAGLLFLVILADFPRRLFNARSPQVVKSAVSAAAEEGLLLAVGDLHVSFPLTLVLNDIVVGARLNDVPVSLLVVDNAMLKPRFSRLLLLRAASKMHLSSRMGDIEAAISHSLLSGRTSLSVASKGLDLGKNLSLSHLGATGRLSLDCHVQVSKAGGKPEDIEDLRLRAGLVEGRYDGGHTISGILALPSAEGIELVFAAQGTKGGLDLKEASLKSSLGSATAEGSFSVSPTWRPEKAKLRISINLTDYGCKNFCGYLALAAGESIDSQIRSWEVRINKSAGKDLSVTVSRMRRQ